MPVPLPKLSGHGWEMGGLYIRSWEDISEVDCWLRVPGLDNQKTCSLPILSYQRFSIRLKLANSSPLGRERTGSVRSSHPSWTTQTRLPLYTFLSWWYIRSRERGCVQKPGMKWDRTRRGRANCPGHVAISCVLRLSKTTTIISNNVLLHL